MRFIIFFALLCFSSPSALSQERQPDADTDIVQQIEEIICPVLEELEQHYVCLRKAKRTARKAASAEGATEDTTDEIANNTLEAAELECDQNHPLPPMPDHPIAEFIKTDMLTSCSTKAIKRQLTCLLRKVRTSHIAYCLPK